MEMFEAEEKEAERLFQEVKSSPWFESERPEKALARMALNGDLQMGVSLRLMLKILEYKSAREGA
jgi:hypothetical protein